MEEEKVIEIPHNFRYRDYQLPLLHYIRNWWKRWVVMWHRRAWKDRTFFNILIEQAIQHRWWYAYILPTYAQGKKIIWDTIDTNLWKFVDHIPPEVLKDTNKQELKFTLVNGSYIQILGSDNIDSLRWSQWMWVVFSEYAYQNPTSWDVIRPILRQSWWFAIFNSTPNGKNHFYDLVNMAKMQSWRDVKNKRFYQKLTVDDTWVVSKEDIEEERRTWMAEEMIQQEFYCSFDVWALWSYYADLISQAYEENRVTDLPYNYNLVDVYFDLWMNDSTSLWFKQNDWLFYNFIHYYEDHWKHIQHYFNYISDWLKRFKLQLWSVYFPHDSTQKRIDTEKTSFMQAQEYFGNHKVVYLERTKNTQKDIDRVREMLPKCRFDKDWTKAWLRCLENYKKAWDDKLKVFKNEPLHDWSSHWADAFRYFAVSERSEPKQKLRISIPNI